MTTASPATGTARPAVRDRTTRAVVTGIGVVAPNGIGAADYWKAVLTGRGGLARISRFDPSGYPVKVAGEVSGYSSSRVPSRLRVQTDLWTHFAFTAGELALADAAVDPASMPPYELSVITASSSGGNAFGQREIQSLWSQGPRHVTAYQSIAWFYAATTGQLSIRHGMKGSCGVLVAEQAGGLDALGEARRALRDGSRLVVTGGTEAPVSPYALTCQVAGGLLSTDPDPATAYRPFAADATGHVPGEGGAVLIVENLAGARDRGAPRLYGEIAGYATGFDPPPGSGLPSPLRRVIMSALMEADLAPEQIDVVFADAAGTREADAAECAALAEVFQPHGVAVTAPKTMTGRLYAGGAPLDVATALLAIRDRVIPPTTGVLPAREYELDLVVGAPRPDPVRAALVVARGHGGFNSAVVVREVED
ncbi:ketosynthase chain-length factor [Streptomyces sp. NPDC048845]|uniref:ketosynthase chain-length factor n=1 Tax=Streptomyces sp. NPDC048845 TaxID=3155390 RepID=UPI003441F8E2